MTEDTLRILSKDELVLLLMENTNRLIEMIDSGDKTTYENQKKYVHLIQKVVQNKIAEKHPVD